MNKYSSHNLPLYINKEEKKIKIIVSKEWCEREGGDGNWIKHTKGIIVFNNIGLSNNEEYTILWDNYTDPFLIYHNNKIIKML